MPRKNTRTPRRRIGFYHVYNRAKDLELMFVDDRDRAKFLEILERYLAPGRRRDASGRAYPCLRSKVRLITFALMPNHFHLVLFQLVPGGVEDLMQRAITAYVKYFNLRHGKDGAMFAGEYRADHRASRRSQLNAIAYVHDNHGDDCECGYCGANYFVGPSIETPPWIDVERGLSVFGGVDAYFRFRSARHAMRDVTAASHG